MPQAELSPAMAARYGVRPTSRWMIAGVVLLAIGFAALLGWIGWGMATPSVQYKLLAFRVLDDARAEVTFEVRRDGATSTVCVVRGQDVHHLDVGYATVTIAPGSAYVQPTYPLATRARATTVEVLGCEAGTPPRVDPPQFPPGAVNPSQVPTLDGS